MIYKKNKNGRQHKRKINLRESLHAMHSINQTAALGRKKPGISPGFFESAKMTFLYFGFSGHVYFVTPAS